MPSTRVESACASGGLALRQGFLEVASGQSDIVLVGGVEKMTDVTGCEATYALGTAADQEYEGYHGLTFPGLYAMMAVAHMHRYGTTRDQLSMVAVKNHDNGSKNPLAQYPFKVSVEAVNKSVQVADPLRILDCSPITDGAAAVIVMSRRKAESLGLQPLVRFITFAVGGVPPELMGIGPTVAVPKALKLAGLSLEDIGLIELNEAFAAQSLAVIQQLGLDLGELVFGELLHLLDHALAVLEQLTEQSHLSQGPHHVAKHLEPHLAQLLLADLVGGFAIMLRQLPHGAQVGVLGSLGQAAQLHVLDHALSQVGHD